QNIGATAQERAVVVAADAAEAAEALAAVRDRDTHPAVTCWSDSPVASPDVVVVLPGQGSLLPGDAHDLYMQCPPFARALEEHTERLDELGITDALELLTERNSDSEQIQRTELQQPLLVAFQLALA